MFGEKLFQTKLLSRLSHKVCRLLSSPVLLRKFTIIKMRQRCHSHAKWTHGVLARLLFAMKTSTVATVYKKVTMITSTHILTLSSLRWKDLYFLLSRINNLYRDFFHWQFFHLFAPWETTWHCFYQLRRVQRWRVSWIRSIQGTSH